MPHSKPIGALMLALAFALAASARAAAQDAPAPPGVNHEVYVHLLVTSDGAEAGGRVPQSLEGVVRQLQASLPPSDYRLAATFINRVRDNTGFSVKMAGAGPFGGSQTPGPAAPSFLTLSLDGVKLLDPASAQPTVNVNQFNLNMRVPVQTVTVQRDKAEGGGGYPVIQYEDVGLSTQLGVREGEPTLVGTLNSSRPGQIFVIVITVRRTGR